MTQAMNPSPQLELRDASGTSIGIYLHEQSVRDLRAENTRLQRELQAVREQVQKLQAQLAQTEAERQVHAHALSYLTEHPDMLFSRQEMEETVETGFTFREILTQLETPH